MDRTLIGHLIGLRYKLTWAKARSRNGKIALFVLGYTLLLLVGAALGAGGLGAGIAAVKMGKAAMVAKAVLSSVYASAFLWTLMLGFGLNAVFSEAELRRYPLNKRERFVVRHFIGIVDPFWFLILALDLGLVIGLYVFGNVSFPVGVLAVLLLLASNYALARAGGLFIDQLAQTRTGPAILLIGIMSISMAPGLIAASFKKNPAALQPVLAALRYTPPFAAAEAITQTGSRAAAGIAVVAGWLAAFLGAIRLLERNPLRRRAAQSSAVRWRSIHDRIGALFGPSNGPLVAHWLRFYTRNGRFRTLYLMSLPLAAFLAYNFGRAGRKGGPADLFLGALGAFPTLTYMGTSRFTVNHFGYTGGGFRRYLLLPVSPGACLRTSSYVSVMLGFGLVPVGVLLWAALAPGGADPRKLVMLVASAATGLFLFNGLGIWSTLLGPRRGNYSSAMGNDLSLAGNVIVFTCMLGGLFLPEVLGKIAPALISPEYWWGPAVAAMAAFAFYLVSLNLGAPLVEKRRERLMAVVEGKS
jgi:hypothetical protein